MATSKNKPATVPGGTPVYLTNTLLLPDLARPSDAIISVVTSGSVDTESSQLLSSREATFRVLANYSEQLEECTDRYKSEGGAPEFLDSRSTTMTAYFFYTPAYRAAAAEYEAYVKSRSCYNANLPSDSDGELSDLTRAIMQWQNFPFIEFQEFIQYDMAQDAGIDPDSSTVNVRGYVYDLASGAMLFEVQSVFLFQARDDKPPAFISGGNLLEKYRYAQNIVFGHPTLAWWNHHYWIALKSRTIISYTPLTTKMSRVERTIQEDRGNMFPVVNPTTGKEIPPPVDLKTTTSSMIQNSGVPRLTRRNLPDSQARLGRLIGGDLAAQLTARKEGRNTTSTFIMSVVEGVRTGAYRLVAADLFYAMNRRYEVSELLSMINDLYGDLSSAESLLQRRVASALGNTTTITKVAMVLALYQIRYDENDVSGLSDFIKNTSDIVAEYLNQVNEYLRLMTCQKNIEEQLAYAIWDRRAIDAATAAARWAEQLQQEAAPIITSVDVATRIYTTYVDFRSKIASQEARRLAAQRDIKLQNFTQMNIATLNYTEDICIGDKLTLVSRRDGGVRDTIIIGASMAISPTSITGTVDLRLEYEV